jgi:hypothetical protein
MKMKQANWKTGLVVLLCVVGFCGLGFAASGTAGPSIGEKRMERYAPPADEAHPHEDTWWDQSSGTFHNPSPYLQMGMDHRFRSVWGENIVLLDDDNINHEWEYQRYRTRWWTKWVLGEDVDFRTRLTWEFRTWDEPRSRDVEMDCDEALFDNFNMTFRNLGGMPLTATIGRQDLLMVFGVGWLVMDATPLDGSRTFFFDAARFTYDWAETNTQLDFVYIDQAAESDRWLKPLSDENRGLTEQDERGVILYATNKSLKDTQLEAYFMYKNDNPVDQQLSNFAPTWSRKAEIFTLGAAVAGSRGENWKYRVEGAMQQGDKYDADPAGGLNTGPKRDLKAYGILSDLEYSFKDPHDHSLHVGYEFASGDEDPNDGDNNRFDLLWGEWPRWSELYIYTVIPEGTVADVSNLHRLNFGHKFRPCKTWQICTDYHYIWADENTGLGFSDGSGKSRGQLLTCWAKYTFTKQLKGHLLAEYFIPGSFYASSNDDEAYFLRFNLEYTF